MYGDIRQFIDDVRHNWKAVAERYQYAKSKFFYHQDFISTLLFNRTFQHLPKTRFINYNLAFQYYPNNRKKLTLQYHDEVKQLELPYAEVINFIDAPDTKIYVQNGQIDNYHQPEDISKSGEDAFQAFTAERPKTTDGPTCRVAGLWPRDDGNFDVKLEKSGYFAEVRTALSLDFPIGGNIFETMRSRDLDDGGNLKPFDQSILSNDLGVFSAVALYSDGDWYFHMMPRQHGLGVFGGMLSSVSGVVEPPKEPISELTEYMTSEIKREFYEETGLNADELAESGRCQVVPLAFTRELSRGGKPQFFYLTILHDVTEKEFAAAFKKAEWKSEFRSDAFSNIKAIDDVVSPEFSTGLFYALLYIQKRRKLPADALIFS